MSRINILTIDLEDGINIAMRDYFNIVMDPTERVLPNAERILSLLESSDVRATFFVVGELAKKYPDLIKRISRQGHEIGVHSYSHTQYFLMSPDKVKSEIGYTKSLLEDITGSPVYGHRAPAFSITPSTAWALQIIAESGFIYDSSIVPGNDIQNRWFVANKEIYRINCSGGQSLIEVPLSVINIMGLDIPVGGGRYLRYFPLFFTQKAFRIIQKTRPVIVYLHPYEIDTEKYPDYFYEAMKSLNFQRRIPLYLFRINKGTVIRKLQLLIKEFRFNSMIEEIKNLERQSGIRNLSWIQNKCGAEGE